MSGSLRRWILNRTGQSFNNFLLIFGQFRPRFESFFTASGASALVAHI
jgi:hypothetical protein